MSHVLFALGCRFSALYRTVGSLQNPILAEVINFSTDYVYESIAKEDMRAGLLADENSRETLIQAEHPGSVL
jgi:hypothetical protein